MFLGEYIYKIDEKGRLPIPPRFRKDLKEGLVAAAGVEPCITIYTASEWVKVAESLTSGAPSKMRRLNRALFANAFSLNIDGQGRIALPVTLRQHARIEDEAVVVGANTTLEVWNKELWAEEKALARQQAWQTIEGLERR